MTTLITHLLFFLLLVSSVARAESEAQQLQNVADMPVETKIIDTLPALFSALSTANQYHSYQSLLTYEANGLLTTFQLSHWVKDDSVYEKLMFMDGPKRQVMRKQQLVNCAEGDTRWGLWPTTISPLALSAYTMKPLGVERVANKQAVVFDIKPKDEWRYGYRYSIDQNTGIVLRVITYLGDDIIERLQTVAIDYIELSEEEIINSDSPDSGYVWRVPEVKPCNQEQFQSAWAVGWLPEGFVLAGNRVTVQGEQVLIFTDGLVSVSVFIVDDHLGELVKATARHGATVVVLAPVDSRQKINVAVVGEVPITTARRIAVSVKPQL